jgi:glycyl-tRNA synthetase
VAEIEHFIDPNDKTHPKFETIANLEIQLYSAENQVNGKSAQLIRLNDAVQSKLINSETLAYFIGRIYLFLIKIGIEKNRIRFRQHMKDEMAHYACDCWDAECKINSGWIECAACADRSYYDLTQHTKFSGEQLVAKRQLSVPKQIQISEKKINDKIIGPVFRKDASIIIEYLQMLSDNEARILHEKLEQVYERMDLNKADHCFCFFFSDENVTIDDKEFIITRQMFTFQTFEKTIEGIDILI